MARAALEAVGGIDILVLNAGGPPPADATETDAAGWARAFQLLATTPIELATLLLPGMRAQGWGRIVAILSSGVRQPIVDLVYSNARAWRAHGLVQDGRPDRRGDGVTVNGVLPGRLATPRVASLDAGRAEKTGRTVEEVVTGHMATIPAGRYGRPEELGSYVAWLASERASYQTGTFSAIDGGLIAGLRERLRPRSSRHRRRTHRRPALQSPE